MTEAKEAADQLRAVRMEGASYQSSSQRHAHCGNLEVGRRLDSNQSFMQVSNSSLNSLVHVAIFSHTLPTA
jgi:hypothetical protein